MRAAGSCGAGADREPAGKLGLPGGGKGGAFLVADADPFYLAAADRVGERVERVADQSEDMLDPELLQRADENVRNRLRHRCLLFPLCPRVAERQLSASALDVGLRPVGAGGQLLVPPPVGVFPRDGPGFARYVLFAGGALRRLAGEVVGREGLGEDAVDLVGPAAVVLDDMVGDLGHGSRLTDAGFVLIIAPDGAAGKLVATPLAHAACGWNFFNARKPSTTKIASSTSCDTTKAGSVLCVGASACRKPIFWNDWMTPTKQLR